jgi:hypothetical protein
MCCLLFFGLFFLARQSAGGFFNVSLSVSVHQAINQAAEDLGEDELAALIREAIEANQEASRIASEVGDELAHGAGGGGGGGQGGASGFIGRSPRLGAAPAGSPALKPMSLGIAVVHEADEWDEKSPLA